ncbi:hypothetical protein BJY01DRAFT_247487 [Aspergillus pseudoustus]|uniref:Uncharacterized protein n=1 Tax=Aspergillus pseudoustus TaxID=1810923 RepID=A0ABR4K0N1_9EURO
MRLLHSFLRSALLLASISSATTIAPTDDTYVLSTKKTVTIKVTNYHTVCPCTAAAALPTAITSKVFPPGSGSGSEPEYVTSTVYTTAIETITACPPSVTNCPASQQTTYTTTKTLIDYVTVCPVTATGATPATETSPSTTSASDTGYTTSTVYTTKVSTITACPSSVKNCPASQQTTYTTTETVIDYTTVCPITATETASGPGPAPTASPGSGSGSGTDSGHGSGPGSSYGSPTSGSISNSSNTPSTSATRSASTVFISTPVISPSRTPTPTPTPTPATEVLAMYVVPVEGNQKRQTYNTPALIGSGSVSASCTNADRFYVNAGHLYDAGLLVAADRNASTAVFAGSRRPGLVRGSFSIKNNVLSWANQAFEDGEALFCVSGQEVTAVFDGELPSGCVEVTVMAVKYSELCGGGSTSTSFQPIPSPTATCSDPSLARTVIPAQDPTVDRSSILNLAASKYATLYYAGQAGSAVVEVIYHMKYPQVTLENSDLIDSVTCGANSITLTLGSQAAYNMVTQWPTSNLILVTNADTCNSDSQRGVYMVQGYTGDESSLTVTLSVFATNWADVSDTMEVSYGVGTTNPTGTTAASQKTACSAEYPSATSTDGSVSYADLTPEQKDIVAYLTQNTTYNDDGSIGKSLEPVIANDTTATLNPGSSNSTEQAALEDALQSAGLPSADDMWQKTTSELEGHCSNGVWVPPTTVYTKRSSSPVRTLGASPVLRNRSRATSRSPNPRSLLLRRDGDVDDKSWWEYLWDIGCNDIFGAIIGAFSEEAGDMIELICKLKDLYDSVEEAYENRDAIKCVLQTCYIEQVVAQYWDYTYAWKVDASIPAQNLVTSSRGTISCVDCSLSVSELKFVGRVRIATQSGAVESAYMTPTMSWTGNLVMGLKASSAWSGQWQYAFDPVEFDTPVSVPGEFTITPSMTYSLGVQWSTTDAVDFTAGAEISVDNASLYLDFMQNTATQPANWSPQVQYTYPVFTTAATVSFVPIMRSSVGIAVEVHSSNYGKQPISLNSATAIGFKAALMLEDGEACPAGQLMMTSYSDVTSNVKYTGNDAITLSDSGDVSGETKCFAVPNDVPTVNEVNSLRSVSGEFCTAYLDYSPSTSVKYAVTTATGPSTTTTTVPTTILYTSTVYEIPTATTVFVETTTVDPTHYVTVSGSQSLGDAYMKKRKRAVQTPAPISTIMRRAPPTLDARATSAAPNIVSTWDAAKISLACSQIATGTVTTTFYTSTATAYSGVVTSTIYSRVDALGNLVTKTFDSVVVSYTATTVTDSIAATATATTATSCPLQSQISCFSITAHGPDHVDGKELYLHPTHASPVWGGWGAGYEKAVFYLTCAGELVSLAPQAMSALRASSYGGGMWVEFGDSSSSSSVKCTKDTLSQTLSCGAGWYAIPPVAISVNDYRAFSGYWQPAWGPGSNEYEDLQGVALTYEEVIKSDIFVNDAADVYDDSGMIFPFLILEAKRARAPDSLQDMERQTALPAYEMLRTQNCVLENSTVADVSNRLPRVWLVSVKAQTWKLYVVTTEQGDNGESNYVSDLSGEEDILKLMLLLDCVFDWALNIYRLDIFESLWSMMAPTQSMSTPDIAPSVSDFSEAFESLGIPKATGSRLPNLESIHEVSHDVLKYKHGWIRDGRLVFVMAEGLLITQTNIADIFDNFEHPDHAKQLAREVWTGEKDKRQQVPETPIYVQVEVYVYFDINWQPTRKVIFVAATKDSIPEIFNRTKYPEEELDEFEMPEHQASEEEFLE